MGLKIKEKCGVIIIVDDSFMWFCKKYGMILGWILVEDW